MKKQGAKRACVGGVVRMLAVLGCLGTVSAAAADEGGWGELTPVFPPHLKVTGMQYVGELCPPGSIAKPRDVMLLGRVPLHTVVESAGEQVVKSCQVTFEVEVQKGYQFGFTQFYVGVMPHLKNVYSSLELQYGYDDGSVAPAEKAWSTVTGEGEHAFGAQLRAWSPTCGDSSKFKIWARFETALGAHAGLPAGVDAHGTLMVENFSIDMNASNDFAWRRCDGEPVYPVR